jgi:hypothetical protein
MSQSLTAHLVVLVTKSDLPVIALTDTDAEGS